MKFKQFDRFMIDVFNSIFMILIFCLINYRYVKIYYTHSLVIIMLFICVTIYLIYVSDNTTAIGFRSIFDTIFRKKSSIVGEFVMCIKFEGAFRVSNGIHLSKPSYYYAVIVKRNETTVKLISSVPIELKKSQYYLFKYGSLSNVLIDYEEVNGLCIDRNNDKFYECKNDLFSSIFKDILLGIIVFAVCITGSIWISDLNIVITIHVFSIVSAIIVIGKLFKSSFKDSLVLMITLVIDITLRREKLMEAKIIQFKPLFRSIRKTNANNFPVEYYIIAVEFHGRLMNIYTNNICDFSEGRKYAFKLGKYSNVLKK